MCLCKLGSLVGVEHIVLLQQLLSDLQDLVVEGEPGVLTDDTQYLWVSQAVVGASHACCSSRRQKCSAYEQALLLVAPVDTAADSC